MTAFVRELAQALEHGPNAVLVAPPGSGKTTRVPPALLDAPWRGDGAIVVLEPRRLAARLAAVRVAAGFGEAPGGIVGFSTRLESARSGATRIEFVTEGLLLRRLLADPGLEGVAAVILDEVHERSLDGDLALALCLDLQRVLRPELRLVAMSATLDQGALAARMGASVVSGGEPPHPVAVRHAARDLVAARELGPAMARAVREVLAEDLGEAAGDVLGFLPGMAEIRAAASALAGCGAEVLPLHGELPPGEQDRALRPVPGRRRVVLATSIAETSLTVPGVRIVVDGGWRRAPRHDASTGLSRLETRRISRAAADQRAGRAGREGPGVAIRLWTAATHRGLAPFERPEMLESELSGLVLACAAWGTAPEALGFPDAPPAGALAAARGLLGALGALEGDGRGPDAREGEPVTPDGREGERLTPRGERMAAIGAHPRLAAMMLSARNAAEGEAAAGLAALLEERDVLPGREPPADLALRLAALAGEAVGADPAGLARVRRAAAQYRRRLGRLPPGGEVEVGRLVAAGFADRIAQPRGEPGVFRLAAGGTARLAAADPLARAKLLAVASVETARGAARIRLAAALDPACLPEAVAARVSESVESGLDPVSGAVFSRRRRRLGALVLEDRMLAADPEETARVLARSLAADPARLPWSEAARQVQARAAMLRALEPDVPDVSDAALAAEEGAALRPWLSGMGRLAEVSRLDLVSVLLGMLGGAAAWRLERVLPGAIALPGGRATVDFLAPVPTAAARAQAFYGLDAQPRLAEGRVAVRVALLSPAGRPVAVTADLPGFWRGGWAEVRRDMRGRYPKHEWPEAPWQAPARPRGRAGTG